MFDDARFYLYPLTIANTGVSIQNRKRRFLVSSGKNADGKDHQPIEEIDRLIHKLARLMIMAYLYVVESADFLFLMR
jgi:hypothetical protein